jgi:hypothetical protein
MSSGILRLPRQHAIPALFAVAFGLVGFAGAGPELWTYFAAFLGGIVLSLSWLVRLVVYLARRKRGSLKPESLRRAILRWSIEPLALGFLAFCVYMPVTFLVRFAVSYPALTEYVHDARTRPPHETLTTQEEFDKEYPQSLLDITRSDDGFSWKQPEYTAGLIGIYMTEVLRNGDIQMTTTDCGLLGNAGITYSPHRQFIHMGETEDTFIHIFGPWYFWRYDEKW